MEELRDMEWSGCTIVEHRADGNVVGTVDYGGVNGQGSFCIGWHHDVCNRTTGFDLGLGDWECQSVQNVVFLRRRRPNRGDFDQPWPDADLYSIIRP